MTSNLFLGKEVRIQNGENPVKSSSQKEGSILVKRQTRRNKEVVLCIIMPKMCLFRSFGCAFQLPFRTAVCSLQTARQEIYLYHQKWFDAGSENAKRVSAPVATNRVCRTHCYRSNSPSLDASTHYKTNISMSVLDHLLQELSTRVSTKIV